MKRLLAMLAALLLTVSAAFSESAPDDAFYLYAFCEPDSFVNIREHGRRGSEVIGELELGERVLSCGKRRRGFVLIYVDGMESGSGWVYAPYLTIYEPVIPEEPETYAIKAKARVASWKMIGGKRREWLKPKAEVKVYATSGEWALSDHGYIRLKYLEKVELPEETETPAEDPEKDEEITERNGLGFVREALRAA